MNSRHRPLSAPALCTIAGVACGLVVVSASAGGLGWYRGTLALVVLAVATPWLVASDLGRSRLPNPIVLTGYLALSLGLLGGGHDSRWVPHDQIAQPSSPWLSGLQRSSPYVVWDSAVVWATALLVWVVLLWPALRGALGMGDVKLAALLCAVLAVDSVWPDSVWPDSVWPVSLWSIAVALSVSAILGAVIAAHAHACSRIGAPWTVPAATSRGVESVRIPFGPPLLAGFWFAVFCVRSPP